MKNTMSPRIGSVILNTNNLAKTTKLTGFMPIKNGKRSGWTSSMGNNILKED